MYLVGQVIQNAFACMQNRIIFRCCFPLNVIVECGGSVNLTIGSSDKIEMFGYQTNLTCTWLIKVSGIQLLLFMIIKNTNLNIEDKKKLRLNYFRVCSPLCRE